MIILQKNFSAAGATFAVNPTTESPKKQAVSVEVWSRQPADFIKHFQDKRIRFELMTICCCCSSGKRVPAKRSIHLRSPPIEPEKGIILLPLRALISQQPPCTSAELLRILSSSRFTTQLHVGSQKMATHFLNLGLRINKSKNSPVSGLKQGSQLPSAVKIQALRCFRG